MSTRRHRVPWLFALCYYTFFALIGMTAIGLAAFTIWDQATNREPEFESLPGAVVLCLFMLGFSIWGLFYRRRFYLKLFGDEFLATSLTTNTPGYNLLFGVMFALVGIATNVLAHGLLGDRRIMSFGAIVWGGIQAIYRLCQILTPTDRRKP